MALNNHPLMLPRRWWKYINIHEFVDIYVFASNMMDIDMTLVHLPTSIFKGVYEGVVFYVFIYDGQCKEYIMSKASFYEL